MQSEFLQKAELITTGDGSPTLFLPDLEESYHSRHGALAESRHVFIENGLLNWVNANPESHSIRILEVGFGTGLNAFLSFQKSQEINKAISFTSLEAYPLSRALLFEYGRALGLPETDQILWNQIHKDNYRGMVRLSQLFSLEVIECKLQEFESAEGFDILYYDAFAPQRQPDMWHAELMEKCYRLLKPMGLWVSYCAKGQLKRDLKAAGFTVKALPGAPGKKEMTTALKP